MTKLLMSLARKSAAEAISSGSPRRLAGYFFMILLYRSSSKQPCPSVKGVRMIPGAMALTLILYLATEFAMHLVMEVSYGFHNAVTEVPAAFPVGTD